MPEYLAPGVYVEEVSFRSKSIEGVPTSTTGFAGLTRFGPVQVDGGPSTTEPRLVTSFTEFERIYGGLEPLQLDGDPNPRVSFLAHAARAFFLNGGKRLYVSRVFSPISDTNLGRAELLLAEGLAWRARWPGAYGKVWVETRVMRSKNIAVQKDGVWQVTRARKGAVVEIYNAAPSPAPKDNAPPSTTATLAEVDIDPDTGLQTFWRSDGTQVALAAATPWVIFLLEAQVDVIVDQDRRDAYAELGTSPAQTRYIGRILEKDNPQDENAVVYLDTTNAPVGPGAAVRVLVALTDPSAGKRLSGGNDGAMPPANGARDSFGGVEADPDDADLKATGLAALGEIDDIAIVAIPDAGDLGNVDSSFTVHQELIAHCQALKYRIAVIDGPRQATSLNAVRAYRGRFDSKYAAIYHPWIEVLDPLQRPAQGAPPARLLLPPSGFVTGIYARSDIERGVHKAPANEIVLGLTRFEVNINKGRQDVLNPEGINALRFFEGRGNRVWGARTMSSDPEWKYVNVRRLFIYLEHSIDKGTQWAVFEPNNERLWANIRRTIEDFLLVLWKDGALLGEKPEQAFFVRCDRTTMTQNDIDNGRLIALVGIAPVKPAEFVIFRVGQWTGDAKN
ncbi:phage tail sheath family protein [Sorangium sp. So ce854]|uniref:phage tail sheath family protein n=1 Tax=Sorangium sp. So ce854 TaxID=3133322 RepID=UPI003F60990E